MSYINLETKQYPLYAGDVKLVDSSWEEGQPLPNGWSIVIDVEPPAAVTDGYVLEYGEATPNDDGTYKMVWQERKLTQAEYLSQLARSDISKWAQQMEMSYGELREILFRSLG